VEINHNKVKGKGQKAKRQKDLTRSLKEHKVTQRRKFITTKEDKGHKGNSHNNIEPLLKYSQSTKQTFKDLYFDKALASFFT
jgi:hypothetical protein